jgi:hypothetical protein
MHANVHGCSGERTGLGVSAALHSDGRQPDNGRSEWQVCDLGPTISTFQQLLVQYSSAWITERVARC